MFDLQRNPETLVPKDMQSHCFYHADRYQSLSVGQSIELDQHSLSRFGAQYHSIIDKNDPSAFNSQQTREFYLENIRASRFQTRPSRLSVLFAALTIEDAVWYAHNIKPKPNYEIPIYEIEAHNFITLDMNWLDYKVSDYHIVTQCYQSYWWGEISNHNPSEGPRRPPRLEVLISLPARVGSLVAHAPVLT